MHTKEHIGHYHQKISRNKLLLTIFFNIMITISEILGGIISGSLALLSDAFHNLTDVFSLLISYIALIISNKEKNNSKTFGYKRAEILAALINIITLLIACGFIIFEAIKRILQPYEIKAPIMLIIASIGFLGNALSILFLFKDSRKNINIKSAFLHLVGDTLSSIGVIFIGIILLFFPQLYFLDAIFSILAVIYIMKESFSIFLESINILMQGIPKDINIEKIITRLENDHSLNLMNIHHVHIWGLSPTEIIFDCHIVLATEDLCQINKKLQQVNDILACEFKIFHTTIQFELEGYEHSTKCVL